MSLILQILVHAVSTFLSSFGNTDLGTQPRHDAPGNLPVKYRLNEAINMG